MTYRLEDPRMQMRSTRLAIVLASAYGLLAGCGSPTDAVSGAEATSVIVSPAAVTLARDEDRALLVSVRSADGSQIAHPAVQFSSSLPNVASVNSVGVVHGMSAGTTTITATSGAVSAAATVIVADPFALIPTFIYADPTVLAFWPGDSARVTLTVTNKWNELISSPSVAWSSSAPAIATVSPIGVVRGVAEGTATVTASSGGVVRTVPVIVRRIDAVVIEGTDRLIPGAESPLRLLMFDLSAHAMRALTGVWTSSDSTVVRVSSTGLATGLRHGTAIMTATSGTVSAQAMIDVVSLTGAIAYRVGSGQVSFLALDGSAPASVAVDGISGNVALSPDGSQLAYDCGAGVCAMTLATRSRRTLIGGGASSPSWTADGARVAVQSGYAQMSLVPVPSGPVEPVRAFHYVMKPRVSADGAWLAYQCDHLDPYGDSSDLCVVTTKAHSSDELLIENGYDVAWSPRGDSLAFVRTGTLCVSSLSKPSCGGDPRRPCAQDVSEPSWSPDGAFLVVVRTTSLWITDSAGRTCMRVAQASASGQQASSPTWGNRVLLP